MLKVSITTAAVAEERDCVQFGEPVAAAGVAKPDWQLVADQLAAAVGENGRLQIRLTIAFSGGQGYIIGRAESP